MTMLRTFGAALALLAPAAEAAEITQQTWDLVVTKANELVKPPLPKPLIVTGIDEVRLTAIELGGSTERVRRVGGPVDSRRSEEIRVHNCNDQVLPWDRQIVTKKISETTVKMTKTVSTTEKTYIEASGNLFGFVKMKGSVETKKVINIDTTNEQKFTDDETVTVTEKFDVPARSRLTYTTAVTDRAESYVFEGTAILDARVHFPEVRIPVVFLVNIVTQAPLSSQFFSTEPGPRTVELQGEIITMETTDVKVVFDIDTLKADDPLCDEQERAKLGVAWTNIDGLIETREIKGK